MVLPWTRRRFGELAVRYSIRYTVDGTALEGEVSQWQYALATAEIVMTFETERDLRRGLYPDIAEYIFDDEGLEVLIPTLSVEWMKTPFLLAEDPGLRAAYATDAQSHLGVVDRHRGVRPRVGVNPDQNGSNLFCLSADRESRRACSDFRSFGARASFEPHHVTTLSVLDMIHSPSRPSQGAVCDWPAGSPQCRWTQISASRTSRTG